MSETFERTLRSMTPDTLVRMYDDVDGVDPDIAAAIHRQLTALVGPEEAAAMLLGIEGEPAPAKETNDVAVSAFIGAIATAKRRLELIDQALEDHFDTLPEDVDWDTVGNAAKVANDLLDIVAFIQGCDPEDVTEE